MQLTTFLAIPANINIYPYLLYLRCLFCWNGDGAHSMSFLSFLQVLFCRVKISWAVLKTTLQVSSSEDLLYLGVGEAFEPPGPHEGPCTQSGWELRKQRAKEAGSDFLYFLWSLEHSSWSSWDIMIMNHEGSFNLSIMGDVLGAQDTGRGKRWRSWRCWSWWQKVYWKSKVKPQSNPSDAESREFHGVPIVKLLKVSRRWATLGAFET